MSQERGAQIIAGWVRAAIHINYAPGVRPGYVEDEETLELGYVYKFEAG